MYNNVAWHERNRKTGAGKALAKASAKKGTFHYMMGDLGIKELINYEPKLISFLVRRAELIKEQLEKAIPEGPEEGSIRSSFYQQPAPFGGYNENRYAQYLRNLDEGWPGYNADRGDLVKKIMRKVGRL